MKALGCSMYEHIETFCSQAVFPVRAWKAGRGGGGPHYTGGSTDAADFHDRMRIPPPHGAAGGGGQTIARGKMRAWARLVAFAREGQGREVLLRRSETWSNGSNHGVSLGVFDSCGVFVRTAQGEGRLGFYDRRERIPPPPPIYRSASALITGNYNAEPNISIPTC
jgi:hypothetical protein